MTPLRIIFAGSGEFGLPTLRALRGDRQYEIVQVFSQPDRPAGRGRKLTPTPIAQECLANGLPLTRTNDINVEAIPEADVMVVIAFGQKISQAVVQRPRLGAINLHASRLPRHRGAAPINWAIISGDEVTGNSIIRLAERMDAGAVLAQSEVTIAPLETAGELHDRLSLDGAPLVLEVIASLATHRAAEVVQNELLTSIAPKLKREATLLDFAKKGDVLARQIRGLYPWPGCRVQLMDADGKEIDRLTFVRARPGTGAGSGSMGGEIMSDLKISTGANTSIEIVEVQPEGKRPMPLDSYRNGHPWLPGMRVESIG